MKKKQTVETAWSSGDLICSPTTTMRSEGEWHLVILVAEEGIPESSYGLCKGPGSSRNREPSVYLEPRPGRRVLSPGKNSAHSPRAIGSLWEVLSRGVTRPHVCLS